MAAPGDTAGPLPRQTGPGHSNGDLIRRLLDARHDPELAVLEGLHALRQAAGFGANVDIVVTRDLNELTLLAHELAPDLVGAVGGLIKEVRSDVFAKLAPAPPATGVISIARRRSASVEATLGNEHRAAPAVVLENPAHRGNIGAVIRVAAAAGASAVITTGRRDPWDPSAIRAAAGLHYAVDVVRVPELSGYRGPLLAVHPDGEPLRIGAVPSNALLAFGSERKGLSEELLARADGVIGIPMQSGVSSLNLATAVAVTLYTWRLAQ